MEAVQGLLEILLFDASILCGTIVLYAQSGHILTVGSTAHSNHLLLGQVLFLFTAPQLLIPVGNNLTLNGYRSVTLLLQQGCPLSDFLGL